MGWRRNRSVVSSGGGIWRGWLVGCGGVDVAGFEAVVVGHLTPTAAFSVVVAASFLPLSTLGLLGVRIVFGQIAVGVV